jgi:hypothetical protein
VPIPKRQPLSFIIEQLLLLQSPLLKHATWQFCVEAHDKTNWGAFRASPPLVMQHCEPRGQSPFETQEMSVPPLHIPFCMHMGGPPIFGTQHDELGSVQGPPQSTDLVGGAASVLSFVGS